MIKDMSWYLAEAATAMIGCIAALFVYERFIASKE